MAETNNPPVPSYDHVDSGTNEGLSEAALLDAVINQSGFGLTGDEPLPEEEYVEEDPAESEEDPESEEAAEVSEESDEEEVEGEDDEESTEVPEAYSIEDLDEEFKIKVPFNGEELVVSVADLVKSYGTDQSHSKKGRELGEARKQFEEERQAQLQELESISSAATATLYDTERSLSAKYHELEAEIAKAKEEGDTYTASELRDQKDDIYKSYWDARQKREGLQQAVSQRTEQARQAEFQKEIDAFNNTIHEYIPDFDENVASQIREFAIETGLPEQLINTITDPKVVKFVDDYRRLKQGVSKGAAKRKAVKGKSIPTKRMPSSSEVAAKKAQKTKARALSDEASPEDQMNFLRNYASSSLSNLG